MDDLLKKLGIRETRTLDGEELDKFIFWLQLADPTPTKEFVGSHCWSFHYNVGGVEYVVTHSGDHDSEDITVEELGPYV